MYNKSNSMKTIINFRFVLLMSICFMFVTESGCKKDMYKVPELTTDQMTEITFASAKCQCTIISDGGKLISEQGVCWSTHQTPTIADNKCVVDSFQFAKTYQAKISNLNYNTTYYVRAYATNSIGIGYGQEVAFTINAGLPIISTISINTITDISALCGGNISNDGGVNITERGVCWSTVHNPTITDNKTNDGINIGSYSSTMSGLIPNTTYYVRAFATNSVGTSYGNELTYKTYTGTVTDVDGNVYYTVTIGTQIWMGANLKVIHYRDGTPIANVTDNSLWASMTTGAYCLFNNEANFYTIYGNLYNWYAASDARNIAPLGWHVPTDAEWIILADYLGGTSIAGGKLKETGTIHWGSPNYGATNETGFTALPGDFRSSAGYIPTFTGNSGLWWTSTSVSSVNSLMRSISHDYASIGGGSKENKWGCSLRCVKD